MKTPFVILCTGGIGSGKSVVARLFRELGVPSYDCDQAAKDLYDRDPQLCADVARLCGGSVLDAGGRIDRAALSACIFSDASLREALEALVHPAVIRDFERWKAERAEDVVLIESAILLEKPLFAGLMDATVAITAPEPVRIARVIARDALPEARVRQRMAAQWSDAQRAALADYVLVNDDREALLPAVLNIIEKTKRRWKKQI